MAKIKIGFISDTPPTDKRAWSGTKNKLYEQISLCDVEIVWVPVKANSLSLFYKACLFVCAKLAGKRYSYGHTLLVAKQLSRSIDLKLVESVDLLFVPTGCSYLYQLQTDKPIIYLTDATFASLYNYYPLVSNFFPFNVSEGNLIEQTTLDKAWKVIVSSDWCKESVEKDYGLPAAKVEMIEFGANVEEKDIMYEKEHIPGAPLRILFLGVEWERKGGDVAVDCVRCLNESGMPAVLHVMGVDLPKKYRNDPLIEPHGFLRKNNPEEYNRFISIIRQSDLLLLPTRAECSAIAFCEASAYGLPIFTYDTGGIPNYVKNGENGYRLPLSMSGADFASKIRTVIENEELPLLVKGCRRIYKEQLNWEHWRKKFEQLLILPEK